MWINSLRAGVCFFICSVIALPLWAQSSNQAADYAAFERFPGSDIADFRRQQNTVYDLALGRMQRVDGRVSSSRVERLQGELIRITYAIPSGYSAEEVYNHFRNQLLTGEQTGLFECRGRGCGSSNYWANDKFGNRVLYGPEAGQFYLASTYRSERDGVPVSGYAALYTVTRGNRRVYAHLDFLQLPLVDDMQLTITPEVILSRLEQDGSVVMRNFVFAADDTLDDDAGLDLLVQALRRDTLLEVFLVGHLRQSGVDTETLQERSRQRADIVRQRLIDAGINASRLEAHGAGPLAPYCRPGPCDQRIEVVTRP